MGLFSSPWASPRESRHLKTENEGDEKRRKEWVKQKARHAQEKKIEKQKAEKRAAARKAGKDAKTRQRNNRREW